MYNKFRQLNEHRVSWTLRILPEATELISGPETGTIEPLLCDICPHLKQSWLTPNTHYHFSQKTSPVAVNLHAYIVLYSLMLVSPILPKLLGFHGATPLADFHPLFACCHKQTSFCYSPFQLLLLLLFSFIITLGIDFTFMFVIVHL